MRVLVCGDRGFDDYDLVEKELSKIHNATPITCIIEGGARGADYLAARWSARHHIKDHARFAADWTMYGKSAGPIRNRRMLSDGKPDLVVAFRGGRGTANMVTMAIAAGIRVISVP